MDTLICGKCTGKVFIDTTFMDNANYELFCLMCGKRDFVGPRHPQYFAIVKSLGR